MRFPEKLYNLVNFSTSGAIQWSESGDSILVEYDKLQKEILNVKENFKSDKVDSFIRQLNLYGFRKCNRYSDELNEFKHSLFMKGRRDLLDQIKRKPAYSNLRIRTAKRKNHRHHVSRIPNSSSTPLSECQSSTSSSQHPGTDERWNYWWNQYHMQYPGLSPRMVYPHRDLIQSNAHYPPEISASLDLESYAAKKGFVSPSHETNLKLHDSGDGLDGERNKVVQNKAAAVSGTWNTSFPESLANISTCSASTSSNELDVSKNEEVILTEEKSVLKNSGHEYLPQDLDPGQESTSGKKGFPLVQFTANSDCKRGNDTSEGDLRRNNEGLSWNDFLMGNPNMCYMIVPTPNPGFFPSLYPGSQMPFPYSLPAGAFPRNGREMSSFYSNYFG